MKQLKRINIVASISYRVSWYHEMPQVLWDGVQSKAVTPGGKLQVL